MIFTIIKKSGGKIFGAQFTAAEQKAMEIEFKKCFAEFNERNSNELGAMILWVLHEEFGFGKERLKKFYDVFSPAIKALSDRYEMDDTEGPWLCTRKLLEYGIDISKWNQEE